MCFPYHHCFHIHNAIIFNIIFSIFFYCFVSIIIYIYIYIYILQFIFNFIWIIYTFANFVYFNFFRRWTIFCMSNSSMSPFLRLHQQYNHNLSLLFDSLYQMIIFLHILFEETPCRSQLVILYWRIWNHYQGFISSHFFINRIYFPSIKFFLIILF